ncbi:MAG: hypothetical protein MK086_14880 [Flavobacteriales bacterium]|nr:hypothetical protein [Flavobacteriales bacterium]
MLRSLGDFLAKTNLFIALAAAFSALSASFFFGEEIDDYLCVFIFFSTLFTYNFQRILGDFHRNDASISFGKGLMIFGGIGMISFFWTISIPQILILSCCGILSFAYAYPFIQTEGGKLSLRLIPRLKLWIIVLVWSVSVAFVPLYGSDLSFFELMLFSTQQGFFVASLTIPFDIRDLRFDSPSQQTIPQILGVKRAVNLSLVFLVISFLCSLLFYHYGSVPMSVFAAYAASLCVSAMILQRANPSNDDLYFTIFVDGMIILQAGMIILAKNYF